MSSAQDVDLVVVGAGAGGLWAAGVAARAGCSVLLLEKTRRTGTKILASGGTRCNLTTTLGPEAAARLFRPAGERFLRHAFQVLPPSAVRERFESLGVPTTEAPLEKVFPISGRARDVRDALERETLAAGARLQVDADVTGVEPLDDEAGWQVLLASGESIHSRRLILCAGGMSFPRTGTTGDGYRWLESLGLPLVPPTPALVPLTSPAAWVHALAGIAWQGGEVRLVDGMGKTLARRRRPLLFTHQGVSGPGPMDVSVHVGRRASVTGMELLLDLYPDMDREELRAFLIQAGGAAGQPRLLRVLGELTEVPPRRLLAAVARSAQLDGENPPVGRISKPARHRLVEALKGLAIPVDGTLGFDAAEVTAGGLELRAVSPRSMQVTARPGLYVFGELLDLDGPIGGFSFQAAFACAEVAGSHVGGA